MNKKLKNIFIALLSIVIIGFAGCKSDKTSDNSADTPTTKEEYAKYLQEKYDYYLNDSKLYTDYDIYVDNFDYNGTNDEFIEAYGNEYTSLKTQLEALKKDLQTNIKEGTPEVDKLNDEVITSIDKTISSIDSFNADFPTRVKDFGTLTKDEIIKGLKDLGRAPYDARMELDKLIEDSKNTLEIK